MTRAWVVAKAEDRFDCILRDKVIPLGRNVAAEVPFAHVSLTPFERGSYALDVIGVDTNEAWIFEVEIPDTTALEPDPSGDGPAYRGDWRVSREPIRIESVLSVLRVPDVRAWESGESET